jgi:predicted dehydrogenase
MNTIRVAVIGAGTFGRHHVDHLGRHPLVSEITVVDRDAARAREIAAAHGARSAAHADGLDVDAAVVAVPTRDHCAVAVPLLRRGIAVLVEKPMAARDTEAQALVTEADRNGVALQVGHIERFSPAFEALLHGAQGIRHIAARRHNPPRPTAPDVDVVLDLMIHDIDLALALSGAPPASVTAVPCDVEGREAVAARLVFASGLVADLSASRLSPMTERHITVHAANGVWRADLAEGRLDRCAEGVIAPVPLRAPADKLGDELDSFLRAVIGETPPRVDGRAGAAALAVAGRVRSALVSPSLSLSA